MLTYQPINLTLKLTFCLLLSACMLSTGQVTINEKSTVQFEGRGTSQKEARRLGEFLLKQGYFNTFDKRTVYLRKQDEHLEITFLINKELFESDKENLLPGYTIWRQWIAEEVFPYSPTRIVLADERQQPLHVIQAKISTY